MAYTFLHKEVKGTIEHLAVDSEQEMRNELRKGWFRTLKEAEEDSKDNEEVTKAEIIEKLKELKIEFNARNKREVLLNLLNKNL